MAHLGTGGPAPVEWVEVVLMDRFKWTLPETRAVPLADGMRLLTMLLDKIGAYDRMAAINAMIHRLADIVQKA